jgi:hypothetical protein
VFEKRVDIRKHDGQQVQQNEIDAAKVAKNVREQYLYRRAEKIK